MAISLDDLQVFESFQGPVHVQRSDGPFVAHGQARLEAGVPAQALAPADVTLGIYDEMRRLERLLPASEITAVHPANPGWLITVSDNISAAEGDAVQTRGATPPTT